EGSHPVCASFIVAGDQPACLQRDPAIGFALADTLNCENQAIEFVDNRLSLNQLDRTAGSLPYTRVPRPRSNQELEFVHRAALRLHVGCLRGLSHSYQFLSRL